MFLLFAFVIALGIVKWLFLKLFFVALYAALIAFGAYFIYSILKKA